MATKRDIGSLETMPVSRHGFSLETGSKQGDLTPLLLLVPDAVPVADLAPELAQAQHALVADLPPRPARAGNRGIALSFRHLCQILNIGGGAR